MCGILAWFHPPGLDGRTDEIRAATDTMAHRGPDGSGIFQRGPIGLGHRRLSIIDIDGGAQPFVSEDGQLALVFNGEIYNFAEVRSRLQGKGHTFRTHSDTEVILHAYREWGVDCLEHFNGMFAFALWDADREILWVVRDRLGIKPLYYWSDGSSFVCASEIRALLALDLFPRQVNERAIDSYLTLGYVPAPETLFSGIRKVEPGMFLEVTRQSLKETRYWDFAPGPPVPLDDAEVVEKVFGLLLECTRSHMVSDVPIGALLSGGLDSSAVVAMMGEAGAEPINSFTIGYNNAAAENEEEFARMAAARYRCRHFARVLDSVSFFDSLDKLIEFSEEPVVEPAAIALYHLAQLAASEVKVVLSGEGSDEIFAGYGIYQKMRTLERIHRLCPGAARRLLRGLAGTVSDNRLAKYLDWSSQPLETRFRGTSAVLTPSQKRRLYHADFLASRGDYLDDVFEGHFARAGRDSPALSRLLYVDAKTWLADDLLLKADKMTMAASIELRVPFLDHRLVEFASTLPPEAKIRGNSGKWALKESMRNRLPSPIIDRAKMGFPVPTRSWFSGDLFETVREILTSSRNLPWIRSEAIRGAFQKGRPLNTEESRFLMTLLLLDRWREHYDL